MELLVVIAILGVLVSLLVAAVQKVRASAANVACVNNLKQIGLAVHQYHDINGAFPSGAAVAPPENWEAGWMAVILPYIGQKALYDQFQESAFTAVIPTFICAADPRENAGQDTPAQSLAWFYKGLANWGRTSYQGVLGMSSSSAASLWDEAGLFGDGVFGVRRERDLPNGNWIVIVLGYKINEITDGLSNTLLAGERPPDAIPPNTLYGVWAGDSVRNVTSQTPSTFGLEAPYYTGTNASPCPTSSSFSPGDLVNHCHVNHFWSFHNGEGNWLLCDGSVRFMQYDAGTTVIPPMATVNGGEVLPSLD